MKDRASIMKFVRDRMNAEWRRRGLISRIIIASNRLAIYGGHGTADFVVLKEEFANIIGEHIVGIRVIPTRGEKQYAGNYALVAVEELDTKGI